MTLSRTLPTTALAAAFVAALVSPAIAGGAKSPHHTSSYQQTTQAAPAHGNWAYGAGSQGATMTSPDALTVSGQMRGANLEPRPSQAANHTARNWGYHSATYGQPQSPTPAPNALTVSGQMRGANLEPRPAYGQQVQHQSQMNAPAEETSSIEREPAGGGAAAVPVGAQQSASSASCSQDITSNVQDNSGGESGTRALNYMMVAGCTDYENFRPQGDQWAAEVTSGGTERTVVVDPENGHIDVES